MWLCGVTLILAGLVCVQWGSQEEDNADADAEQNKPNGVVMENGDEVGSSGSLRSDSPAQSTPSSSSASSPTSSHTYGLRTRTRTRTRTVGSPLT
jgi:hypothetical protein